MQHAIWSERYALGIAEIDTQHKELFTELALLWSCAESTAPISRVDDHIERFSFHVQAHCSAEEAIMRLTRHPNLTAHLAEHAAFIIRIDTVTARLRRKRSVATQLLHPLLHRLVRHIDDWDRPYAAPLLTGARQSP